MSAGFDDDDAFNNLSKKEGMLLHRLSYHCANLDCNVCDGKIHYKIREHKARLWSAATGKFRDEFEDKEWDPNFTQVQLEGGELQSKENTPEGSKCECFCHKARPKGAGPPRFLPTKAQEELAKSQGKKLHELLSTDDKRELK